MNRLVGVLVAFFSSLGQGGASHSPQSLAFQMDRDGPPPTHYTLQFPDESGAGTYSSTAAAPAAAAGDEPSKSVTIHVSEPLVQKLFATLPIVAGRRCESHSKHVAQTGKKLLRFTDGGTAIECSYNYSDDDRLNVATNLFEAIAETMQYGDRLAAKLRFDRLGLDTEMENLQSALGDHRAVEVGNIAPVLRSIAEDDRVLDRVRRKASRLLEDAGAAPVQSGEGTAASAR